MSRRRPGWGIAALALAALAGAAPGAVAQVSGTTGVVFQSWKVTGGTGRDETTVSQAYVPVRASVRLGDRTDLMLIAGGAAARLENPGSGSSLDGVRALTARVFHRLPGDRVLFEGSITAPSGKTHLTADQLRVSQSLALPLFGFALRQYGAGPEAGGGVTAFVLRRDDLHASLGVGGTLRGKFTLADGEGDFRPGSEWVVTAGADYGASDDGPPWRLDLAWRSFTTDQLAGQDVFKEGAQLEARLDAVTRRDPALLRGWVRITLKQDNRAPAGASLLPGEYRASSGNAFVVGGSADQPWGERVRVGVLLDHTRIEKSEEFGRNGRVFGGGPVLGLAIGEGLSADLSATFHWGRLDGLPGGGDSSVSGYAFALGLRRGAPR